MRTTSVALVLAGLLAAAAFVAVQLWRSLGTVELSGHGIAAMALGIAVTLGLGIGLMRLSYVSHKSGHDDDVGGSASSQ